MSDTSHALHRTDVPAHLAEQEGAVAAPVEEEDDLLPAPSVSPIASSSGGERIGRLVPAVRRARPLEAQIHQRDVGIGRSSTRVRQLDQLR